MLGLALGLHLGMRRGGGAPYTPALKFNDARNSQYLAVPALIRR